MSKFFESWFKTDNDENWSLTEHAPAYIREVMTQFSQSTETQSFACEVAYDILWDIDNVWKYDESLEEFISEFDFAEYGKNWWSPSFASRVAAKVIDAVRIEEGLA